MRRPRRVCLALLALAAPASAQCTPDWSDRFSHPDFDRPAYATVVFDDGTGPALYAGGNFQEAGSTSASLIAKWKGVKWQPVGAGIGVAAGNFQYVTQLAAHDDDGPGPHPPALYASGNFTVPGTGIAKWDGVTWTAIPNSPVASVMASIDDDGPGPLPPALYIGGTFTTAGGIPASNIVRWDGVTWSPLGAGITANGAGPNVRAILQHDEDGPGPLPPRLFVGGFFGAAGGQNAYHIAAWDGQTWSPLGGGMTDAVNALGEFDEDGPGPETPSLIATGNFTLTSGFPSNGAARWKNGAWSALGSGPGVGTGTMVIFDLDGPGPAAAQLVARQPTRLISWNGASWSPIPGTFSQGMSSSSLPPGQGLASLIAFTPLNSLPRLVVSGNFRRVDSTTVNHIAQREGALPWQPLQSGLGITLPGTSTTAYSVATLTAFKETGSEWPGLIAGGSFIGAGSVAIPGLARLAPSPWGLPEWTSVGTLLPPDTPVTSSLVFDDDGPGPHEPALHIATYSSPSVGVAVAAVARWDGAAWTTLGTIATSPAGYSIVFALASFDDDGPGPNPARLCAGGWDLVNGSTVASWNGSEWTALGSGLSLDVHSLAEFDSDGPGPQPPQLYAGTLQGLPRTCLYRLESGIWTVPGGGIDGNYGIVRALTVMDDDGPGPILPALYVGGTFNAAGPIAALHVARFDGQSWSSLGGGLDPNANPFAGAYSMLQVDEDGPGPGTPVLTVGGAFTVAGGNPARCVARWNPASASWSSLGAGIDNPGAVVNALAWIPGGPQAGLYAAGYFKKAGDTLSSHIARWACGTRCYNNCDASTINPILNVNDFICFMNSYAAGQSYANCDQSTLSPILNVNDFSCFLNRYAAGCP